MRVALLVPNLSSGDAVSNDVLGMQARLAARGIAATVHTPHSSVAAPFVGDLAAAAAIAAEPGNLLIHHFAVAWPDGHRLLAEARCRRMVKFHNVTPPEFFAEDDDDYFRACSEGVAEMATLAGLGCDRYVSDSAFSQRELIEAGVDPARCRVLAPFHHTARLFGLEADLDMVQPMINRYPTLLMVGRVAPNKRHDRLLRAFHHYVRHYQPHARLLVVGGRDPRLGRHNAKLDWLVEDLMLESRVSFTGAVPNRVLKACYLGARVFLMTSDHEGFCVPVVEAMAFKLPVVAFAATAVPETVGSGGLVWEEDDPALFAASIDRIVRDEAVAIELGNAGHARFRAEFEESVLAARFDRLIDELAGESVGAVAA